MALTFLDRFRTGPKAPAPQVFDGFDQVRAYWEGLRQDAQIPARSALDPRGLGGVLDRVFLAERIGRGVAQIRIAGSGLADFAALDPRGLPLSCLFAPESRPVLAEALEQVFAAPAVAEIDLGSDRGNQGKVIARLLLLPLQAEGDRQQVLGIMGFCPEGAARCKLQVLSRRAEELLVEPASSPATVAPIRRRGHLALVHSNA